uniref:Uncharacterized protein n=1 Tax=Glossina pallidipes TaxID=7398 RepID=A0A1B0ADH6_GLOPL
MTGKQSKKTKNKNKPSSSVSSYFQDMSGTLMLISRHQCSVSYNQSHCASIDLQVENEQPVQTLFLYPLKLFKIIFTLRFHKVNHYYGYLNEKGEIKAGAKRQTG